MGEVVETGDKVTRFKSGDKVWYAGAINRTGTNAEYHLVDARIVGHAPKGIDTSAAAALPLTTLTAQEMIFDRLKVADPVPGAANAIVIIGGAGGVGSIAIQLLREQTGLTIIATASRPETQEWVKELGAHHVVDHSKPLPEQITALNLGAPAFVFSTNSSETYVPQIAEFIDDVDVSAGSVELGVTFTPPASIVQDYITAKRWAADAPKVVTRNWAGETSIRALRGLENDLRNTWWIIIYNRQSLDEIVSDGLFARD